MCEEVSQCYSDVNICLWTDGSELTHSAAQTACQRRASFLPRITNSNIQDKLAMFRSAAYDLLFSLDFWIDVSAAVINHFHWIDNSPLAGDVSVSVGEYIAICPRKIVTARRVSDGTDHCEHAYMCTGADPWR